MSKVTLIGARLADPGAEFVYEGEASACEGCPYRSQCLNLTDGVKYQVTDVRQNAQTLECAVHDEGVRAVEGEAVGVRANVPSRQAYAGSKVELARRFADGEIDPDDVYQVPREDYIAKLHELTGQS